MQEIKKSIARTPSKLLMIKVSLLSLATALAVTLYLLEVIDVLGLLLIIFGGIWNTLSSNNNLFALLLCIVTSVLAGIININEGLYANALTYLVFYIVLGFAVTLFNMNGNTELVRYKKASGTEAYYIVLSFLIFLAICFAVAVSTAGEVSPLGDAIVAVMLALSAYTHARNLREYYIIRPFALVMAIALTSFLIALNGASRGLVALLFIYLLYFVIDAVEQIFRLKGDYIMKHTIRNVTPNRNLKVKSSKADSDDNSNNDSLRA